MRIVLFCENKYAIDILYPIYQEALKSEDNQLLWYIHLPKIPVFPLQKEVTYTHSIQEVYDFSPEAIFVPGNIVPYYLPGVKVQVFHGYDAEKKDLSGTLICCGMAGLIAFQSFLNISVATGILPNTGTPLPFVSYGLTSLVTLYIGMGLVLNVGLQNRDFVTRNYELLRRKTINEHRIDRA